MTKLEMLFIRACKSHNPEKRLKSVYRRYYLKTYQDTDVHIAGILLDICEKYCPVPTKKLVSELNPDRFYTWEQPIPYWTSVKNCLVYHIRFIKADDLPDLIRPLMWRK